jgi:DNA-binding transcriptional ArsR family regulator
MSSPAISHHLKQLKYSGLITSRRVGKEVYYKAADTNLVNHLHKIIEELAEVSCPN